MLVTGLGISLLASIFMAYGKVFRRKETIEEQSGSTEVHNQKEKEHRMRETRFAQIECRPSNSRILCTNSR